MFKITGKRRKGNVRSDADITTRIRLTYKNAYFAFLQTYIRIAPDVRAETFLNGTYFHAPRIMWS